MEVTELIKQIYEQPLILEDNKTFRKGEMTPEQYHAIKQTLSYILTQVK